MPEYLNVVFIAPKWRQVVDASTGTVTFEAVFDGQDEKCISKLQAVAQGVPTGLTPECVERGCMGECEPVTVTNPDGSMDLKCICNE